MGKENVNEWFSGGNNFRMSDVQREYVWEATKAQDLLIELQKHESNFLGGVAYRESKINGKTEFIISDGCQRLTTLLLIIKAYDCLPSLVFALKNKKQYFKFANAKDTECIQRIIESNSLDDLINLGDLGKRPIIKNYRVIKSMSDKDENKEMTSCNVMNTCLFGMLIPEDCDEVDVFVNLNSKGKAVKPSEMVKAYFQDGDGKYDTYNNIANTLNNLNETYMEKFLKCEMFANKSLVNNTQSLLDFYKTCNISVFTLKEHAKFFENIMGNKYIKLINAKNLPILIIAWLLKMQISNNPESSKIINLVVRWLYFNCPYISSLTANNNKFQTLECKLFTDYKDNEIPSSITYLELKEILKELYVNPEVVNFIDFTKKGLKYKLSSPFIISIFEDLGYDLSYLKNQTVEHIYAQNCVLGQIDEQHLHCLGNLTLLGQKLNSTVGNLPPLEKFKTDAYKLSGFKPTIDLMEKTSWSLEDIEVRHQELSTRWYEIMMKEI